MTILDIQTAKEISELLEEGKSLDDIRKLVSHHGGTINAWIAEALLSNDIDEALLKLRDALITRVLKDTAVLGMLKAASKASEHISYKTTILSDLSKSDKAMLEKLGYAEFTKRVEKDTIILKVEETRTVVPANTALYEKILKCVEGEVEVTQKLIPFAPVHKDLPDV